MYEVGTGTLAKQHTNGKSIYTKKAKQNNLLFWENKFLMVVVVICKGTMWCMERKVKMGKVTPHTYINILL